MSSFLIQNPVNSVHLPVVLLVQVTINLVKDQTAVARL
jgi:hypothetical protein